MNIRNPWLNLLVGTLFGFAAGGMLVSESTSRRVDRLTAEHAEQDKSRAADWQDLLNRAAAERDACQDQLVSAQAALTGLRREASPAESSPDFSARAPLTVDSSLSRHNPVDDRQWYTLVYVPAPAGQQPQPLEMLNLVRPGLGTLLSKLTAQQQQQWPQGGKLEAILDGRVKGVALPQGMHLVWTMQTAELPQGN